MSDFPKNTEVTGFTFGLINATDGSAVTTGTVSGFVTLDGGTQAALTNAPVHEGNGQWSVDLTAGEMNGDIVGLVFTETTAVPVYFTIRTFNPVLIASAVWDALMVNHVTASSIGSFMFAAYSSAEAARLAAESNGTALAGAPVAIANEVLGRDLSSVPTPAARSLLEAARKLRNKVEIDTVPVTPQLVVYEEDDTTEAYRQDVASDPNADPITGLG